jgi:hypothetical protein
MAARIYLLDARPYDQHGLAVRVGEGTRTFAANALPAACALARPRGRRKQGTSCGPAHRPRLRTAVNVKVPARRNRLAAAAGALPIELALHAELASNANTDLAGALPGTAAGAAASSTEGLLPILHATLARGGVASFPCWGTRWPADALALVPLAGAHTTPAFLAITLAVEGARL